MLLKFVKKHPVSYSFILKIQSSAFLMFNFGQDSLNIKEEDLGTYL